MTRTCEFCGSELENGSNECGNCGLCIPQNIIQKVNSILRMRFWKWKDTVIFVIRCYELIIIIALIVI